MALAVLQVMCFAYTDTSPLCMSPQNLNDGPKASGLSFCAGALDTPTPSVSVPMIIAVFSALIAKDPTSQTALLSSGRQPAAPPGVKVTTRGRRRRRGGRRARPTDPRPG